jgi:thioesterase domain-containing protein
MRLPFHEAVRELRDRIFTARKKPIVNLVDLVETSTDADKIRHYAWSLEQQYGAITSYSPQPYKGQAALFTSRFQRSGLLRDTLLGWDVQTIRNLTRFDMPGEHDSMFREPIVDQLAASLNECLAGLDRLALSGEYSDGQMISMETEQSSNFQLHSSDKYATL